MALKNLFDMVKADRYTADGREELIKAQEAETEDKVYQIGEISQKTGLQKTANGWVKPKSGKQPGAKKDASGADVINNKYYKNDVRTEEGEKKILSETKTEVLESKVKDLEDLKQRNGGKLGVQGEKSLQLAKAELAKRNSRKPESKPKTGKTAERPSHEQAYLDAFKDEKLKSDVKAAIKKYGATGNNLRNALYKNDKELSDKLEKMQPDFANQFIAEMQRESNNSGATDSAPRVLTGDTRIRVRKA